MRVRRPTQMVPARQVRVGDIINGRRVMAVATHTDRTAIVRRGLPYPVTYPSAALLPITRKAA